MWKASETDDDAPLVRRGGTPIVGGQLDRLARQEAAFRAGGPPDRLFNMSPCEFSAGTTRRQRMTRGHRLKIPSRKATQSTAARWQGVPSSV